MAGEPDQFADFSPKEQPRGAADEFADFNPHTLATAPKEAIPHALMQRFSDGPWSGGASPVRFLNEGVLTPAQSAAEQLLRTPNSIIEKIGRDGPLDDETEKPEQPDDAARTVATAGVLAGAIHPFARSETFASSEYAKRYAAEQFKRAAATPGLFGGLPRGLLGLAGAAGAMIASGPELIESLFEKAQEAYRKGLTPEQEAEFATNAALLELGGGEIFRKPPDRAIGVVPKPQDFATAAKVIAGKDDPIVADKAIRLHDEFGINPAEVVHDAKTDPEVAASMTSPQIADLPRKYTEGEKSEDQKLDEAAGVIDWRAPVATPRMAMPGELTAEVKIDDAYYTGPTHHEAYLNALKEIGKGPKEVDVQETDGFLTAEGEHISRAEANDRYANVATRPPPSNEFSVYHEQARDNVIAERDRYAESQTPEIKTALEAAAADVARQGSAGPGGLGEMVGGRGTAELTARGGGGGAELGALEQAGGYARPEGAAVPGAEYPGEPGAAAGDVGGREGPAVAAGAAPTAAQLPPIGVGGAGMPRANPYFTYDDRTFAKVFIGAIRTYKKTFQPELISDRALQAEPLFAAFKSATEEGKVGVIKQSEDARQFWRPTTDTERFDYVDRVERLKQGAVMPAEWKEKAERHRIMLDAAEAIEKEFGSKAAYREDYFPHQFLDPDKARGFVNAKVAQLGPTWFQKERVFDLLREALESGLRLKTTNPEDMVVNRLLSSVDMQERMKLLKSLEEMNLSRKVTDLNGGNYGNLNDHLREGWQPINAPDREQWLLHPDIQPLWKNAVDAKGFWAMEGPVGSSFRAWMAFKAVWVPIKLALTLFHPLHVYGINVAQGLARGWTQIVKGGDFLGAAQSVAEGVYGPILSAVPGVPHLGKDIKLAWETPKEERTPQQQSYVDVLNDGGFVPQMSEQLRINARRALEEAMDKGSWLKTIPAAIRRGIEIMQAPIFEKWIPSLKAAAYFNDYQALMARRPELLDNKIQRMAAARTIAKSVDNRFGEMFYGGLFWNRYVKDAGIASFLSLSWNLGGMFREFGGALLEPEARLIDRMINGAPTETQATIRDAQNKLPMVISYAASGALFLGMLSWALSGKPPEGLDWVFPRTGRDNPDGTPHRLTSMFYHREIPMLLKHVQEQGGGVSGAFVGGGEMLYNKMLLQPFKEFLQNKDYYGSDIWDENGPLYTKAWQYLTHTLGEQASPISISGAKQSLLTGGDWKEAALAMMGFGPAPSYVSRDADQNRIAYLYDRHVAPFARTEESGEKSRTRIDIRNQLLIAQKNNDQAGLQRAANEWMKNGGSRLAMSNILLHVPGDIQMFRRLEIPDQEAVMKGATPANQARYKPYLKTDIAVQAANLTMQAEQQRAQGNGVAATATEQQLSKLISDAAKSGQITNLSSFRRALAQQLTARHAPDIAAIMAQPKKMRSQYMGPPQ
jgi:hypothetical protein